MKYNTRGVTNISEVEFIGKFGGVDIIFSSGQTRFLPSHIAEHIATSLAFLLYRKQVKAKKSTYGINDFLNEILSAEIATKKVEKELNIKDEIEHHEKEYADFVKQLKKEEILKAME